MLYNEIKHESDDELIFSAIFCCCTGFWFLVLFNMVSLWGVVGELFDHETVLTQFFIQIYIYLYNVRVVYNLSYMYRHKDFCFIILKYVQLSF